MHIHILGICGTFMGGVARLALAHGHTVTGSDSNIYPPMSTQLAALGVTIFELDDLMQFDQAIDQVVIGNVMVRGMPATEHVLEEGLNYTSGPAWLADNVLHGQHVLAVAGTHGKTTTSSMLAWILQATRRQPGFLIGGVPANFNESAAVGAGDYFVVEADEYDSAFFDKRSKFVHYRPRTVILNNLEFDHADIFDNLEQIQRQFHHLIRTVPSSGRLIVNADETALARVLDMGCWSEQETFALNRDDVDWSVAWPATSDAANQLAPLRYRDQTLRGWRSPMPGAHNACNALAAVAAAYHIGVPIAEALECLHDFTGVARRMQHRGTYQGVAVYDDFAHHPTAIATTLDGVRRGLRANERLIAVLEPRSNTMKTNAHVDTLAASLRAADQTWLFVPPGLSWSPASVIRHVRDGHSATNVDEILEHLVPNLRTGDHIVVMSNGGFDGFHDKLLQRLIARESAQSS